MFLCSIIPSVCLLSLLYQVLPIAFARLIPNIERLIIAFHFTFTNLNRSTFTNKKDLFSPACFDLLNILTFDERGKH